MSAPKPARSAIAVTESQEVPRPHVTRWEFWANVIVGGVLVAAVLLGAVGMAVAS